MYEGCRQLLARRGLSVARDRVDLPRPARSACCPDCRDGDSRGAATHAAAIGAVERGSTGRVAHMATRKRVVVAASTVVVTAAAVAGLLATRGAGERTTVAPNSIVALDPSGSVAATVSVGARPVAVASGADALWVGNLDDQSVTRVDPASRQAVTHSDRRHADGPRRHTNRGLGDRRYRRHLEDQSELRPTLPSRSRFGPQVGFSRRNGASRRSRRSGRSGSSARTGLSCESTPRPCRSWNRSPSETFRQRSRPEQAPSG